MVKMHIPVIATTSTAPVLFGGPVDTGRVYILHSNERSNQSATTMITSEIALTPTIDMLRAISDGSGPAKWLLTLGYAGWGPGQIEDEILHNGWIHCDADASLVFDTGMDSKWQQAFAKLGAGLSGLSSEAGRA
jgi:putative transcriptional regulator